MDASMDELLNGVRDREDVRAEAEERLARLTGEEQHVAVLAVQQETLRDNGLLVNMDVRGLSQFYCQVDWKLDLGIPDSDERKKSGRLSPGRKWLIDVRKFRSLETQARRNLEKHGFRISIFGGYLYIPDTAFQAWHEKHQAIVQEWNDLKVELLATYDNHMCELEKDFAAMARDTWLTLVARATTSETAGAFLDRYNRDMKRFIRAVVEAAKAKAPTKEQIRAGLKITLHPATFMLGSEMEREYYEQAKLTAERQKEYDQLNYWRRREQAQAEAEEEKLKTVKAQEEFKRRAAWDASQAEANAAKVKAEQEIERARIETAYVREAKAQIVRDALAEMTAPIVEVINALRGDVLQNVREVTENIHKNGRVLGKTAEKIENTITMFRLLNSAGNDQELADAINTLENAMGKAGAETKRDTGGIRDALGAVAAIAMQDVKDAAGETRADGFDWLEI